MCLPANCANCSFPPPNPPLMRVTPSLLNDIYRRLAPRLARPSRKRPGTYSGKEKQEVVCNRRRRRRRRRWQRKREDGATVWGREGGEREYSYWIYDGGAVDVRPAICNPWLLGRSQDEKEGVINNTISNTTRYLCTREKGTLCGKQRAPNRKGHEGVGGGGALHLARPKCTNFNLVHFSFSRCSLLRCVRFVFHVGRVRYKGGRRRRRTEVEVQCMSLFLFLARFSCSQSREEGQGGRKAAPSPPPSPPPPCLGPLGPPPPPPFSTRPPCAGKGLGLRAICRCLSAAHSKRTHPKRETRRKGRKEGRQVGRGVMKKARAPAGSDRHAHRHTCVALAVAAHHPLPLVHLYAHRRPPCPCGPVPLLASALPLGTCCTHSLKQIQEEEMGPQPHPHPKLPKMMPKKDTHTTLPHTLHTPSYPHTHPQAREALPFPPLGPAQQQSSSSSSSSSSNEWPHWNGLHGQRCAECGQHPPEPGRRRAGR